MSLPFPFILLLIALAVPLRAQPLDAPYAPGVDVERYTFRLTLDDATDRLEGEADVTVAFTADTLTVLPLDLVEEEEGRGMRVASVTTDGQPARFTHRDDRLVVRLDRRPRAGERRTFTVAYGGVPADGLIIGTNRHGERTFFGDNWPNRARHWLPTVDHPSDKALIEWAVTAPAAYQVVANGRRVEESDLPDGRRLTRWATDAPLATKIAVIGAARFAVEHRGEVGDVPVETWAYPQDRDAGFHDFAVGERALVLFTSLLGEYPFEKLANVQSTTRYGGMENASAIFYDENGVTGERRNEGTVAHEVAHQWFGNAVTEGDWPHLWLSEGFATYLTHVYHEFTYGRDRMNAGLARDRDRIAAFAAEQPMRPLVDTTFADPNELLNPNSYQKGSWVLHLLRRQMGDEAFFAGLRTYYARFRDRNATTADLERVMEEASGEDLSAFFQQWTRRPGLPLLTGSWRYDEEAGEVVLTLRQTQPGAPFAFPLEVDLGDPAAAQTLTVDEAEETFRFDLDAVPAALVLDPNVNALAQVELTGPTP